eukprot:TRINITY_DN1326_c0_g1_i1.p1 TRINITY_DN1326_c0_g1~~TRINITY_DN1326_c0_g1_i1.p1  ORF type:complete len:131 (-),score=29.61 TRINITY_DN1326_c0_g1_i1:256-648(-)
MLLMDAYMFYAARKYRSHLPHLKKYGPLYLTIVAGMLIMADLTRHVLADLGIWKSGPWPGSSEYRDDCNEETIKCLSGVGIVFTIICTYSGFILLFIATMWSGDIISKFKKIKAEFKRLRNARKTSYEKV